MRPVSSWASVPGSEGNKGSTEDGSACAQQGLGLSMLHLAIKAAISGVLIALVSEIARRSPGLR